MTANKSYEPLQYFSIMSDGGSNTLVNSILCEQGGNYKFTANYSYNKAYSAK